MHSSSLDFWQRFWHHSLQRHWQTSWSCSACGSNNLSNVLVLSGAFSWATKHLAPFSHFPSFSGRSACGSNKLSKRGLSLGCSSCGTNLFVAGAPLLFSPFSGFRGRSAWGSNKLSNRGFPLGRSAWGTKRLVTSEPSLTDPFSCDAYEWTEDWAKRNMKRTAHRKTFIWNSKNMTVTE